jgi:hypothetical protein
MRRLVAIATNSSAVLLYLRSAVNDLAREVGGAPIAKASRRLRCWLAALKR